MGKQAAAAGGNTETTRMRMMLAFTHKHAQNGIQKKTQR